MRYWDASALVPLVIAEKASVSAQEWLAADDRIVTWAWTRVEITSAVERRTREGLLSPAQRRTVLNRMDAFAGTWDEVHDVLAVRRQAAGLLARHPLRAADAGQLGAALILRDQLASRLTFVCLDERLSSAAEKEGLHLISPL